MKLLKKALSVAMALAMSTALFVNSSPNIGNVTAAEAMRSMTSQEIVSDMGLGWNLGNTFDSFYSGQTLSPSAVETAWGNPTVTKEMIQAVKGYGFKTVRIPVTWMNCMSSTGKIDTAYLDRVQEVVDYCIDEGLYVVLNMHHDGSSDSTNWIRAAKDNYSTVSAKYSAVWTQISKRFADYSDYLIFESMNEVEFSSGNPSSAEYETLNKLNQLFVDTVRATGSNNSNRHLLIAGYITDIDKTCDNRYVVPEDSAGRCIVSVHYYSPSDFCVAEKGASWGYRSTWGTTEDYDNLETQLNKMVTRFVSKGTPVIIGEYGVLTEDSNGKDKASIAAYLEAVAESALKKGMCPILWDSGNGGDMQYINRTSKEWNNAALKDIYKNLSEEYSSAVTTPSTTKPVSKEDFVTVKATKDAESGNMVIDLTPYVGKLITGVGFTVKGEAFPGGNGGVLIGFNVYDDSSSWGGAWKGVSAQFLGADVGQITKFSFDPNAEDEDNAVDPKTIMYDGQQMSFSISYTWNGPKKTELSIGEDIVLYFDGSEQITETTTSPFESKFAERVTAVITDEVGKDEIARPVMEIDISKYKGNKLVGVEFSLTGTHGDGNGALSYNLIDETAEEGTKWAYTSFNFTKNNDPIEAVFDKTVTDTLDYDFLRFNIWYEKDGKSSADYSFDPNVTLYFEDKVVIQTTTPVQESTEETTVTSTVVDPTNSTDIPTTPTPNDDVYYGDVDCNGQIESLDIVLLNTYLLDREKNALSDQSLMNANCEYDSVINMADTAKIINCVAEIITKDKLGPQT